MSPIRSARLSRSRRRWTLLAAMIVCAGAFAQEPVPPAHVDRCATDVDPGGTNLTQALASGRRVAFSCGGPAKIKITRSHSVDRGVEIDGGGTVTLDGGGTSSFLAVSTPAGSRVGVAVVLENLTIQGMHSENGASVVRSDQRVSIINTTIRDSEAPVNASAVVSQNSVFENNTGVVIAAKSVTLTKSTFKQNKAIPVELDSGEASVTDSVFDGNGETTFGHCTRFTITRTSFSNSKTLVNPLRPGGALRVDCSGEIVNSTFDSNSSNTDGGALAIADTAKRVVIMGSRFTGNTAQRLGGAVFIDSSHQADCCSRIRSSRQTGRARAKRSLWEPRIYPRPPHPRESTQTQQPSSATSRASEGAPSRRKTRGSTSFAASL